MFARSLRVCLFVFSTATCLAAETPTANPAVPPIEAPQKEMEVLLSAVEAKQAAALDAITAAVKASTIKRPEESKYRFAVENAYRRNSGFVFSENLTRQISSAPPPDSIAVALSALEAEIKRAIARAGELEKSHADNAARALGKIAESGTKPEELDAVDKQIALGREATLPHDNLSGEATFNALEQLSRGTRALLDGMQKQDAEMVTAAFYRFHGVPPARNALPAEIDNLKRTLQARSTAIFQAKARDSFAAVQRALIDGLSRQLVEDKIVAFQKAAADLAQTQRSSQFNEGRRGDANNVVQSFRSTAEVIQWLKNENAEPMAMNPPSIPEDSEFPVTAEYRTFVLALMPKFTERRNLLQAREEVRRRDAERKALEQAETEARAALEERRKAFSQRIAAADSPETILALANDLVSPSRAQELASFRSVQAELRQAAACWLESNPIPFNSAERGYESHPFVIEMRAVRERVNRAVAVKRLPAPQLLEAPLAALPLREALEQVLRDCAGKGDWKQSLEILRFLALGEGAASGPANDRYKAVHSYLTGLNLEAAGQLAEAADSYLIVLRTVGDPLPMKEAAEQLKKVRASQSKVSTKAPAKSSR